MLSPVPGLVRSLAALGAILRKAEAFCVTQDLPPAALLEARLAPSMKPLTHQIRLACNAAVEIGLGLAGRPVQTVDGAYDSFADLQERLAEAGKVLAAIPAESFALAEAGTIGAKVGEADYQVSGWAYLTQYGLPNVYFAITIAYAILRGRGVPLGKVDFLGPEGG